MVGVSLDMSIYVAYVRGMCGVSGKISTILIGCFVVYNLSADWRDFFYCYYMIIWITKKDSTK